MMSEKQPHISDMVERVARAVCVRVIGSVAGYSHPDEVRDADWLLFVEDAEAALEASRHAELVEALSLAAKRLSQAGVGGAGRSTIKGWADETFAFLAKIGGDA